MLDLAGNEKWLIDANEVEEMAGAFADQASTKGAYAAFWKVIHNIRQMPTVDAVEVVHGRWIHDINNLYGCSECGERETMSPKKLKNYCPNCGAKMDGDGNA